MSKRKWCLKFSVFLSCITVNNGLCKDYLVAYWLIDISQCRLDWKGNKLFYAKAKVILSVAPKWFRVLNISHRKCVTVKRMHLKIWWENLSDLVVQLTFIDCQSANIVSYNVRLQSWIPCLTIYPWFWRYRFAWQCQWIFLQFRLFLQIFWLLSFWNLYADLACSCKFANTNRFVICIFNSLNLTNCKQGSCFNKNATALGIVSRYLTSQVNLRTYPSYHIGQFRSTTLASTRPSNQVTFWSLTTKLKRTKWINCSSKGSGTPDLAYIR